MSVVMPVHNALPFLDSAIESILGQTFSDFEFVILDDASSDGSRERLREWALRDHRIRLIEVQENLGPARSSERVARAARAPIVARMDGDDISHPQRLEKQLQLLRRHENVGLVATLSDVIDSSGRKVRGPDYWRLRSKSWFAPFAHGAIMYRRSHFDRLGGYRDDCEYWEDQDLIARIRRVAGVLVIPEALYQVRQWSSNVRIVSDQRRLEAAMDLSYRAVERLEHGRNYDDLLGQGAGSGKIDPRTFISLGSMTLWAGGRPKLFRRLLSRGDIKFDRRSINAILWTGWASISPGSLRQFLLLLRRLRNAASTTPGEPVPWSPAGAPTIR